MTHRRVALRTASLVASGFVGFLAGHSAEYLLITHDPVRRALLLRATGHSYWGPALHAGIFAAVVAAGAAFVFGCGHVGDPRARLATPAATRSVVLLQTAGFVGVEVLERASAGAPIRAALGIIAVGVGIQIAIALIATAVLTLLDRAGARIARALAGSGPGSTRSTAVPRLRDRARARWFPLDVLAPRAPPSLS